MPPNKYFIFLFLIWIFACQEQKNEKIITQKLEDSLHIHFKDKLAKLNVRYKYCNPIFLNSSDGLLRNCDNLSNCQDNCNDIFKISRDKLFKIGLDSISAPLPVNKGYSFHKFTNGFHLLGLANYLDGLSPLVVFYLFDKNGKYITELFSLFSSGDAGSNTDRLASIINDTINIRTYSSSQHPKEYFSYKNYVIYFKNDKILTDTLKKEYIENINYEQRQKKIIEFYEINKKYKQRILLNKGVGHLED